MRLAKLSLIDKVRWRKKPNDRPEKAGAAVCEGELHCSSRGSSCFKQSWSNLIWFAISFDLKQSWSNLIWFPISFYLKQSCCNLRLRQKLRGNQYFLLLAPPRAFYVKIHSWLIEEWWVMSKEHSTQFFIKEWKTANVLPQIYFRIQNVKMLGILG